MLKGTAFIFAMVFILLGIFSFIPLLTPHHRLFNLLNIELLLALLYITTGLIALSASGSLLYSRLFFKLFGIIYAAITILGFSLNGNLGVLHTTLCNSFFHLFTAIIALYLGFTSKIPRSYSHLNNLNK